MRGPAIILRSLVWCSLFALTVWASTQGTSYRIKAEMTAKLSVADIVYRRHHSETRLLDLYLPPDQIVEPLTPEKLRPAVLLVHGGSWMGGSRLDFRRDPWRNATRLAERGLVVVAADYTLARPGRPSWPAALDDLRDAVRWIRKNAQTYRIDPDRISVLGHSAGAHLAMLLGTEPDQPAEAVSSRVQAVISFYGPTDLEKLRKSRRSPTDPIRIFLGGEGPEDRAVLERSASPLYRVRRSTPPMLLFHGTDDTWVPVEQSRNMAQVLDQRGVSNRLVLVEGSRHGFETIVEAPSRRDLLPEILSFLSLENLWNGLLERSP